jgi:hypothetical protein
MRSTVLLICSISSEVNFLIPTKEFLAALLRINSSSFAWIAELSQLPKFERDLESNPEATHLASEPRPLFR